jgi:D-lactate dehydrogenase (cytochrome)
MDAVNRRSGLAYPLQPTLFFEFHGTAAGVAEQAETVRSIASALGGGDFQWATRLEDRNKLWRARHEALYAALALRPGGKAFPTDVCVPISRLAECITATRADLEGSALLAPILGHVGDGNFHVTFIVDPGNTAEIAEVDRVNTRLVERALAMDGTCTGEHGVGYGKSRFLRAEHGAGVDVMRAIKNALDPRGLMNPGKILPLESGAGAGQGRR